MLNLYREHTKNCTRHHKPRLHTRKAQESPSLGWKRCSCPIYASGTLQDGFSRRKTDYTTWEEAEKQAAEWEQVGAWSGPPPTPPRPPTVPEPESAPAKSTTISEGLDAYLAKCNKRGIRDGTSRKYQAFIRQFRGYCDRKGYVQIGQLQVGDGELFYASWKDGPQAGARKLRRFKKLVKFWNKQEWLSHDLGVFDIESPVGCDQPADQFPFTDAELERIYRACDEVGEVRTANHLGTHSWSGSDVKDFIVLAVHTGLRISDLALFDVSKRLEGNDIFIRAKKNDRRLYTWVPDWVRDILLERQRRLSNRIFQLSASDRLETITNLWRVKLHRIFTLAQRDGLFENAPKPHRLRHTFVRILLEKGVPVATVAELAGDTEDVILKYYAKWVPAHQERLRNILKDAFADKPKLVAIPKRQLA